ncbi:hypothetical protein Tco_0528002 [Tanacetum coccineum]
MTFLVCARFCPEYVKDEKLLMEHYIDMLKKDIRKFISAKNWKNLDELIDKELVMVLKELKGEVTRGVRIARAGECCASDHATENNPNNRPQPCQQGVRRNTDKRGEPPAPRLSGAPNPPTLPRPLGRAYLMSHEEAKESYDSVTGRNSNYDANMTGIQAPRQKIEA